MVALNILRVRPWHRYAVIETAGSQPGLMQASARLLRPDVALVLNVMRAHTYEFDDLEAYAAEKAALVAAVAPGGLAVLNADDERVARMPAPSGVTTTLVGASERAEFRASEARSIWPGRLTFTLHHQGRQWPIETQLVGTQWLNSAAAVMATAISLGMDAQTAAAALKQAPPFAGRLNPAELPNGAIMLRDDHGATADTLEAALRVLDEATASRKLLVITDISDYPGNRVHRLRYLGRRAGEVVDGVVFIGESARYGARRAVDAGIAVDHAHGFDSLKEAAEFLRTESRAGDLVLLAGRNSDHATRVFFAQLGSVGCWKGTCRKRMLCDICWELNFRPDAAS
jgi:UDP-N-acetylmuramoyl-tripeptide--D-alanyl-D-alanine ligase